MNTAKKHIFLPSAARLAGQLAGLLVLLGTLFFFSSSWAAENQTPEQAYSTKGSSGCLTCHSDSAGALTEKLELSIHNSHNLSKTPGGEKGCESCHGPSAAHAKSPKQHLPAISFHRTDTSGAKAHGTQQANQACQNCHQKNQLSHWQGSVHQQENLSCNQCHTVHSQQDPVLNASTEIQTCTQCHTQQKAELHQPSHHPVGDNQLQCSSCHTAHGSLSENALKTLTLNETCFNCHAEKRGPFLFEHAPASEDCGLCHTAHGSVQPNLLKSSGPFLCQQCHMAANHPSVAVSESAFTNRSASVLGRNCLNCHSQVHGSNHPSGARLTR